MPQDRIQAYQRQLAEDEARLRRELAQAPGPARGGAPTASNRVGDMPPTDPIADEQRRREYQSLFADNVALSRRPADAPSYAERATPTRAPNRLIHQSPAFQAQVEEELAAINVAQDLVAARGFCLGRGHASRRHVGVVLCDVIRTA